AHENAIEGLFTPTMIGTRRQTLIAQAVILVLIAIAVFILAWKAVKIACADLDAVAAAVATVTDAHVGLGIAVAAIAQCNPGPVKLARENLDDAADRIRTPVARARAAHDFDALDGRQRKG